MTSASTATVKDAANNQHGTLRAKLLRVMLGIVVPLSLLTLACVAFMQYRVSDQAADDVQKLIRDGVHDKGRVLTSSHALALVGLVADNAFGDVQALVERAVEEDPDIVYGLFLSRAGAAWAYVSPATPVAHDRPELLERWTELGVPKGSLHPGAISERQTTLFGQQVLEFAAPVLEQGDSLGTVRYGLSTARTDKTLLRARERARRSLETTLLVLGLLALLNVALGVILIGGAARRIAQPLAALTDAAHAIAQGRREARVTVASGDEIERLAAAFNHMLEVNQRTFEQLEATTERALEASRLKSEFLANMSHEIRTPMNGVMGMSKLILKMPLEGRLRRYAETIDASANSLLTIINDVLDFSKMEAGKYELHAKRFEPRVVIQDVCELLAPRATDRGLELVYRIDPQVPQRVEADPDRFRQILSNLVGNAIKFTERGEIFIDLRVEESAADTVLLKTAVTDSGIGIAEKDMTGIFDAFSQVDGSLVRKHGGTGLGLAISRRLAEMMGGAIGVWSRPGVGSQFWFTVRARPELPSEHTGSGCTAFPLGKRALVVEANHRWCDVMREHMQAWGVDCECVQSGEQALARIDSQQGKKAPFDVAVIGGQAGQIGLRELVSVVKERSPDRPLPLILLTPLGSTASFPDVESQISAQLTKPLRMSDLYNALHGALAGRVRKVVTSQTPSKRPRQRSSQKVLVVDDNPVNQFVAVEQLLDLGFAADVANHGGEAVEMVQRGEYALVLMDCQMPVKDGYAATREIREHEQATGKHQIIVALTAHAMEGERERVATAGMDDYLSKPLRGYALERMLARYVQTNESATPSDDVPASERAGQAAPAIGANDPGLQAPKFVETLALDGAVERASAASLAQERPVLAPDVLRSRVLIEMCLRETPKQLVALEEALARGAAADLRAAAHKLKGTAMALAADQFVTLAERLQHRAGQGRLEEAALLVEELGGEYLLVEAALQREHELQCKSA